MTSSPERHRSSPPIKVETLTGAAILPFLPDLARLRIAVFREFPYLYEGDSAYEQNYMRVYADSPAAAVIIARDGEKIVGASTCLPLSAETPNMQKPFLAAGMDISRIYYFGESVLDSAYRGQGIGVKFFAAREAQARKHGYPITAFCAVQRPADHPARPKDYQPLDDFWRKRGYTPHPELLCSMSWREVDADHETVKPLMFWTHTL